MCTYHQREKKNTKKRREKQQTNAPKNKKTHSLVICKSDVSIMAGMIERQSCKFVEFFSSSNTFQLYFYTLENFMKMSTIAVAIN